MKAIDLSAMKLSPLVCMNCGYQADLLAERKFICPRCGGLFDVQHVFNLPDSSYGGSISKFDERAKDSVCRRFYSNEMTPLRESGVWRFKEWIMPYLPMEYVVTLKEGNVPIIQVGRHLRDWLGSSYIWMILEGMTSTGSFKDFGGTVMISVAKAAGIKAIGCASTGDTSAMAAAYATAAGMKCLVILPEGKVTAAQLAQPLVHGATVITLPGSFDDCMMVVRNLVEKGLLFPANSLNPTRIEGHQATVFLIAQYFGWGAPEWIALPVGNGSNCSSVGKAMRLMQQLGFRGRTSRILGCQSQAANPLAHSWETTESQDQVTMEKWQTNYVPMKVGETTATAARIGNPVSYLKVMREIVASNGRMSTVSEKLLNEAVAICGRDGYFVCPQTGTALAGVKQAIERGKISPNERVVVISTANGLKFTEAAAQSLEKTIIKARDCQTETIIELMNR